MSDKPYRMAVTSTVEQSSAMVYDRTTGEEIGSVIRSNEGRCWFPRLSGSPGYFDRTEVGRTRAEAAELVWRAARGGEAGK